MNFIEPNSYFSTYLDFTLSPTDLDVLNLLYLPIVGKDSIFIYNLFFSYGSNKNNNFVFEHDSFCKEINLSESDFLYSRNKLEGIGLIETYRKEEIKDNKNIVNYIYKLNPPATANKFFNDPILSTLLQSKVSSKEIINLKLVFKNSNNRFNEYTNVSTKFNDIFVINNIEKKEKEVFLEKKYKKAFNNNLADIEAKLLLQNINPNSLNKYEKVIEKYLALYQISDDKAVDIIASCISTDNVFNEKNFIKKCQNAIKFSVDRNTNLENLNKYNSDDTSKYLISTKEFLYKIFNAEPPMYILNNINEFANKYDFTPDIINAVLDYSITNKNGQYNYFDIDNICMYLSYNKVKDLFSAIQFLKRKEYDTDSKKINKNEKNKVEKKKENKDVKIKKIDVKKLGLDI